MQLIYFIWRKQHNNTRLLQRVDNVYRFTLLKLKAFLDTKLKIFDTSFPTRELRAQELVLSGETPETISYDFYGLLRALYGVFKWNIYIYIYSNSMLTCPSVFKVRWGFVMYSVTRFVQCETRGVCCAKKLILSTKPNLTICFMHFVFSSFSNSTSIKKLESGRSKNINSTDTTNTIIDYNYYEMFIVYFITYHLYIYCIVHSFQISAVVIKLVFYKFNFFQINIESYMFI